MQIAWPYADVVEMRIRCGRHHANETYCNIRRILVRRVHWKAHEARKRQSFTSLVRFPVCGIIVPKPMINCDGLYGGIVSRLQRGADPEISYRTFTLQQKVTALCKMVLYITLRTVYRSTVLWSLQLGVLQLHATRYDAVSDQYAVPPWPRRTRPSLKMYTLLPTDVVTFSDDLVTYYRIQ